MAVIGRDNRADIQLDHSSISREHAQITLLDGKSHFLIEDLGSANGTCIDGMRIRERTTLYPDQQIEAGPFRLSLCLMPDEKVENSGMGLTAEQEACNEEKIILEAVRDLPNIIPPDANLTDKTDTSFSAQAEEALYRKIIELLPPGTKTTRAEYLTQKALTISLGLGPLEGWLKDPGISEIMINGTESLYIERNGKLDSFPNPFSDEDSILRIIDRILSPLGRRVDDKSPYVDGRLPDGSRINVIIPPACLTGPVVTIRKFPEDQLNITKLIKLRTLTQNAADFLKNAVVGKRNILISGGTGSGKTTLLNCLSAYIPPTERIITIEDAAELNLGQEHVVRLETRPPNIEGGNEIVARDLLRNSLRMRPDRIIVGECRGGPKLWTCFRQ